VTDAMHSAECAVKRCLSALLFVLSEAFGYLTCVYEKCLLLANNIISVTTQLRTESIEVAISIINGDN